MTKRQQRLSNFEWLRFVAMFLIVFSHLATHGPFDVGYQFGSNGAMLHIISGLGNLGVVLFIFVSSYFLVDRPISRRKSVGKLIHLSGLMIFYNLALWVVARLWRGEWYVYRPFSPFGRTYWFMSYYLIFLLAGPILAWVIDQLDLKWRQYLLLLATILFVGGLTTGLVTYNIHIQRGLIFAYSFLLMSVFKHNPPKYFRSQKAGWRWIGLGVGLTGIHLLLAHLGVYLWTSPENFILYFSPAIMSLALGIFTVFRFMSMSYSPKINWIASKTLGVYLIHEHWAMRGIVWGSLNFYEPTVWWKTLGFALFFAGSVYGLSLAGAAVLDFVYHKLYQWGYKQITERMDRSD